MTLPVLLERKGGQAAVVLDNAPPVGSLVLVAWAGRSFTPVFSTSVPNPSSGPWTTVHSDVTDTHGYAVAWKIAGIAESTTYSYTASQFSVAVYAPGATIGDVVFQDDITGTVVDCGGPITPDVDAAIWGFAMNTWFFGTTVIPDNNGETTNTNTIDATGNPPGLWAAFKEASAGVPTSITGTLGASMVWSGITVEVEGTSSPVTPPDPGPDPPVVYDPDDVELATLTEAFDIKIRIEHNGTGSGQFSINRHSADALAAALKPGNYVRVAIPQIDPDAIFGFFLEGGTVKVVSTDEEGGEIVTFGGRGGLAYWDRAIWLNQSFLVEWWPAYIETAHGAPPAGTLGAVRYAPGSYKRYTLSGRLITSRIAFTTAAGFSSYYDQRLRVHDSDGNYTSLVHLTTGGVAGWWVKPYGAGVTDYRAQSQYVFGPSIAMESITTNQTPGEVIYVMYQEATSASRPIQPLPLMTIDFDDTLDSDGNAWTVADAVTGLSADLGEDYLSTIGKIVNLGVVDVAMGPDLDMHAYNSYGRDLHSATYAANKVRFEKGVNIADELSREYSDSPVGTFAEVLGNQDGVIARVELADAATRTPREISVRGDTDDVTALEDLGLSELEARLLHSDAIGFNVATPIVGQENELAGLYLPGPPGSANGNYWIGDLVTLHTGTGEHDFNEQTVRIAAITIQFSEANSMLVTVEVNSGFGGYQPNGGSTASSTSTTGGGVGGTLSDLYQLVSEKDNPMGYPSLDDDGLIHASQLPTQWKQSVRFATTGPVTLATGFENGDTVDGVTLVTGDEFLNKDAAAGAENGIYVVAATGAPTRRADYDADVDIVGSVVRVREGTANADTVWLNTNDTAPTIGTTALTFAALSGGGSALTIEDEGTPLATAATTLDFVGAGVTATGTGTDKTITIPGDAAHIADTSDAHDASAISVVPTGSLTATDVQAALAELDGDISAGGIPATIFDAKGDLIAASAADTAARLAAAANGASLITASGESTGLKWRLNNDGASAAPTVNDDAGDGYSIGSRWLDTTNDKEYVCLDATTTAAVWVETSGGGGGSDLVQTYSGGGSVYIPGLRGSPDQLPASPSSDDDEFESLSGWTTLGTLDTNNVSDVASHLHIKRTLVAIGVDGLYKTAPSMPFTVTIKYGAKHTANYDMAGILLTEASPGKLCTFGLVYVSGVYQGSVYRWTNRSTFSSNVDIGTGSVAGLSANPFPYLRIIVASSTDISAQVSHDGMYWFSLGAAHNNITTGLTVANVGVCIGDAASSGTTEAYVDWIRFT